MTTLAIVLAAALGLACVLFVARSLVGSGSDRLDVLSPEAQSRLQLVEERDRLLAELQELEFDHKAGTVSDEDYREQVGPLRQEIGRVLSQLDTGDGSPSG